jgi:hypothetical protein
MVSDQFFSKFKSDSKAASDNSQIVADLIRVRNGTITIRRWPQMIKW